MAPEKQRRHKSILNDASVIEELRTNLASLHWATCSAYLQDFLRNRFPYLSPQIREEFAQEAAFLIYQSFASFRGDSAFTTWAGTIAFHHTIDMLRKKHIQEIPVDDSTEELRAILHLQLEDPEEFMLRRERMEAIRAGFEEFLSKRRKSVRDREILHKLLQGYGYHEIAQEFQIEHTVVSSVLYAFRKFWENKHYKE